jgi:glutamine---fructose-6-phosphate transaminase (isomerizing)
MLELCVAMNVMTHMEREAREAPDAVARFLERNAKALIALGGRLRIMDPPVVLTSARGSSDHAAGYLKYLTEIALGVPCASIGASVASVYGARIRVQNCLTVTISQSGQSPDIVSLQEATKSAGALTVAIVNAEDSPAAKSADICLAMHAGPEQSIAATKSFIVSLVASAAIIAAWRQDAELQQAIQHLPEQLQRACELEWSSFVIQAKAVDSLYVLGRGPSFPIAAETALKLKETCALHAEAYSVAEVMHGPLELVQPGFPVLVYAQADQALERTRAAISRLKSMGAQVSVAGAELPVIVTDHALLTPIPMIQTAHLAIEAISRKRGRNPDVPRQLKKVTETI